MKARKLGRLVALAGENRAVMVEESIMRQLREGDWQSRRAAAEALGKVGNLQAVPALLEVIRGLSSVPGVTSAILDALESAIRRAIVCMIRGAIYGAVGGAILVALVTVLKSLLVEGTLSAIILGLFQAVRPMLQGAGIGAMIGAIVGTVVGAIRGFKARQENVRQSLFKSAAIKAIVSITEINKPKAVHFLCQRCLTRLILIRDNSAGIEYFACRICQRVCDGQEVWCNAEKVRAVLDDQWGEGFAYNGDVLLVNWLKQKRLFDFDEVAIIKTPEAEIERLCIQVRNDMDKTRRDKYKQMLCIVECEVSKNTQRIVENTFGRVERLRIEGGRRDPTASSWHTRVNRGH